MKRSLRVGAALLVLAVSADAQRSAETEALLVKGLQAALRHQYVEARASFESASKNDLTDPAPLILLAGLLHTSAEDLSVPFDRRSFDSLLTRAEVVAASGPDAKTADRRMWHATARGMLSVVESRSGQWMAAIRDALSSSSDARIALDMDPGQADAGLSIGNYLYWRSRTTEAIQWLPFISDDRDEGIRLLEWCATDGRFHRWTAMSSLIWVLHDAGALDRAEAWARRGLESFPENRTFLAGLAKVLESRGAAHEAARAWETIEASLRLDSSSGRYAVFSASVNHARCLRQAGEAATAALIIDRTVPPRAEDVPEWIRPRLAAKKKEWEGLRTALANAPRRPGDDLR